MSQSLYASFMGVSPDSVLFQQIIATQWEDRGSNLTLGIPTEPWTEDVHLRFLKTFTLLKSQTCSNPDSTKAVISSMDDATLQMYWSSST